jgi:hypothetical protein
VKRRRLQHQVVEVAGSRRSGLTPAGHQEDVLQRTPAG